MKKGQKQPTERETQQPQIIKEEPAEKFRTAATYNITFSKGIPFSQTLDFPRSKRDPSLQIRRETVQSNNRETKITLSKPPGSANSGPISPRAIKAIRQTGKMNFRGFKKAQVKKQTPSNQEKLRFSIERAEESSAIITEHTETRDQCVGEDEWLEEEDEDRMSVL